MVLTSRIISSGMVFVLGCQLSACSNGPTGLIEPTTGPSESRANKLALGQEATGNLRILACPPSATGQATRMIGPEGGVLTFGPHRLHVPSGSLREPTTFRSSSPPGGRLIVQHEIVSGDGQAFEQPIAVTISYGHCRRQDGKHIQIVRVDDSPVSVTESEPVEHDEDAKTLTIHVHHLSTFAVAY